MARPISTAAKARQARQYSIEMAVLLGMPPKERARLSAILDVMSDEDVIRLDGRLPAAYLRP